jgi:calcineurin-like phosphoesterase family protein
MINDWNKVVNKNGIVIHLGDFSTKYNFDSLKSIMDRLNGNKILIKGNHDIRPNDFYKQLGFRKVYDRPILIGEYILSHEPVLPRYMRKYIIKHNKQLVNYHGHSHKYQYGQPYQNFNVDIMGYRPKRTCLWDIKEGLLILMN